MGVHYEALRFGSALAIRQALPHRLRVAVGILVAFVAHSLEALLFAGAWAALLQLGLAEPATRLPTVAVNAKVRMPR